MRYFPFFVDIHDWNIVVIGAGKVAERRVASLLNFQVHITIIAPRAVEQIQKWAREGRVRLFLRPYRVGDLAGAMMVLATADNGEVNDAAEREARDNSVLFNRCDDRNSCDFHFPGLCVKNDAVVGIHAGGEDHRTAARITGKVKEVLADRCV